MALKDIWIDKVDDVDINSAEDINQVAHAVIELEENGGVQGENGATFTPNVSAEGVISWTNDRGLQNPPPVNIKGEKGDKGEQGERGLQGIQGERGADGAKGDKGDKGDRGEQGIQGIKGERGEKGKTAYEYAQDGGYTGTEAEYTEDINPDAINAHSEEFIITELAKRGQLKPEFANSIEECTDTSKLYVLPDGYIYAYKSSDELEYTNLFSFENADTAFSWISGSTSDQIYQTSTDFGTKDTGSNQFISKKGSNAGRFAVTGGLPTLPAGEYVVSAEVFMPSAVATSSVSFGACVIPSNKNSYEYHSVSQKDAWVEISHEFTVADGDLHTYIALMASGADATCYWRNIKVISKEDSGTQIYKWESTGHAFIPADYEYRIVELETSLSEIKNLTKKKWVGKKWVAFGDSLTEANRRTTKNYHGYVADETGISVVNMGYSGSGFKRMFDSNQAYFQRILNVPTDADVVTIMASGNDLSTTWLTYGLGEVTDTGTDTICGCINTTIDNLYSVLPTVQLGIITPTPWDCFYPFATADPQNRMSLYSEAIVKICKMRGIPCLDLYHCSGLRPWESSFKALAYSKDDGGGTHPDETGHRIIAPRIKAFLERLLM
jgi:lysophospholipase L1-like esterase